MRHLEPDYEVENPPVGFIPHFWTTISALGGWKGLLLINLGVLAFYFTVEYIVTTNRNKRELKRRNKQK
jgi:hypothetical protein